MSHPPEVLLERAITIIMGEFGFTKERAMEWLNDDTEGWEQPNMDYLNRTPNDFKFIQASRKTVIKRALIFPSE